MLVSFLGHSAGLCCYYLARCADIPPRTSPRSLVGHEYGLMPVFRKFPAEWVDLFGVVSFTFLLRRI